MGTNQSNSLRSSQRYDYGYQSIHLNLKQQADRMKLTQIMLAVRVNGQRLRVYTRLKVEPAFWDKAQECCHSDEFQAPRLRARMERINLTLAMIRKDVDLADMRAAEGSRLLSSADLRRIVRCDGEKRSISAPAGNVDDPRPLAILHHLADQFDCVLSNRGSMGSTSSRKFYLNCCKQLEKFEKETHYTIDTFSRLDGQFYQKFSQWLSGSIFRKGDQVQKYSATTVRNTTRALMNLHRKAFESGLSPEPTCTATHLKHCQTSDTGKIYLTETEIGRLRAVIPRTRKECQIRDMFILSCYTALRLSDINQLNNAIIGEGCIRIFQKKTKGQATIPVLKEVSALVGKYSREPGGFPLLDPGETNRCIKSLCSRAGICDLIQLREFRGGETLIRTSPKCDLVTFHTARRSCITNLFRRGYSPNYLMTMSGHRSISSFQRYIRSNTEELSGDFLDELKRTNAI